LILHGWPTNQIHTVTPFCTKISITPFVLAQIDGHISWGFLIYLLNINHVKVFCSTKYRDCIGIYLNITTFFFLSLSTKKNINCLRIICVSGVFCSMTPLSKIQCGTQIFLEASSISSHAAVVPSWSQFLFRLFFWIAEPGRSTTQTEVSFVSFKTLFKKELQGCQVLP